MGEGTGNRPPGSSTEPRRNPLRPPWLPVAVVAVAAAAVLAVVALRPGIGGPPATAASESPSGSGPSDGPSGAPAVGDVATLADDAVARLNGIEEGVTLDPGMPGPEPGMRLDRLDVEICAGRANLFVDAAFWNGLGDDQQVHSAHMGVRSFFTLTMAPGSCQRGNVELAIPEGVALEAVLLMDTSQTTAARWSADGEVGDPEPLASVVAHDPVALGTSVALGVGGSATVYEADSAGALVTIAAELCADEQHLPFAPRHWLLRLADHRLVVADEAESTMGAGAVEPGACVQGTIAYRVPAGPSVVDVLYAYGGQFEQGSWAIEP